jgi:hypothetical protein
LTTAWADSVTTLSLGTYTGGYAVTIPAALPIGDWDFLVYDNGTPADTDAIVYQVFIRKEINGGLVTPEEPILVP